MTPALDTDLRIRAAASIHELLGYLESEFMGLDGLIGESANVAARAYAVLDELKREA